MNQRRNPGVAAAALAALLCGCSGTSVATRAAPELAALRARGYRIAVMPFAVSAPEEGLLTAALAPVSQLLALDLDGDGLPPRMRLANVLRLDLCSWLGRGQFELVEPWFSDTALVHAGWSQEQMRDPARAPAAAKLLQVDGVLYGDVTRWNRDYYLVQSQTEVAVAVELRHGEDGKVLFAGERSERMGAGLSGGPTGFVSAATSPIAGLDSATLRELTRSVARGLAVDLDGGGAMAGTGDTVPRLSVVSVVPPPAGAFAAGDRVEVLAVGTPDCEVRFDLGRLRTGVPMQLRERIVEPRGNRAVYAGHYVVQPGDDVDGLPVGCSIRSAGNRRELAARYLWTGTVDLHGGAAAAAAPAGR